MDQRRRRVERICIVAVDLIAVALAVIIAYSLRYEVFLGREKTGDQDWVLPVLLVVYLVTFFMTGNIRRFFRRGPFREFLEVIKTNVIMLAIFLMLLYAMHRAEEVARLMVGYFMVASILLMFVFRLIMKSLMVRVFRGSKYANHMLLVTDREHVTQMLDKIEPYHEWYRAVTGIALTDEEIIGEDEMIEGIPVVTTYEKLVDYVVHHEVDEVFFAYGGLQGNKSLTEMVNTFSSMGVITNVNIDEFDLTNIGKKSLGRVGKYAVVAFERNAFSQRDLFLKRVLDIIGSLIGMVFFLVAAVFLVPIIKLDSPGPAIFGQTRIGKNGRKFTFYKFRSMYVDAEARKAALMEQNEVEGLMFKMENDPRITRVGRFIRKTSLDELPQFWNVLKGDMSLVGTRPPTVDEYERYEAKHKSRLSMKPGITGMWQVSGRSDIKDFDEVVRLDMDYIDNWNIGKDIKILFKTIGVVFGRKGSK